MFSQGSRRQEPADPRQLCLPPTKGSVKTEAKSLEKLAADLKLQVKTVWLPALKHGDNTNYEKILYYCWL